MSIGSFVLGGIGGGSTVALFVNEGFGKGIGLPTPAVAVVGGIVRRGKRRFEVIVDGVRFTARSPLALQAKVAAWRRARIPANDTKPEDETYGKWRQPRKEVLLPGTGPLSPPTSATLPAIPVTAPGAAPFPLAAPRDVAFPALPIISPAETAALADGVVRRAHEFQRSVALGMVAQAHREAVTREVAALRAVEAAAAHAVAAPRRAADEDDIHALLAILEAA